jgi:hypothetical protein
MGESVAEATIIKWLEERRAIGWKPMSPSWRSPRTRWIVKYLPQRLVSLLKRLVNDGDVVKVGQPIAQIGSAVGAATHQPPVTTAATGVGAQLSPGNGRSAPASVGPSGPVERNGPSGKFYSPLVRNIAQSEGVSLQNWKRSLAVAKVAG